MNTKNKFIKTFILLFLILFTCFLVSCNNEDKEKEEPKAQSEIYTIKVIDLDDEIIGSSEIEVDKYANVFEAIKGEFRVVGEIGQYGAYITSINESIVDKNWSMMLYVNGVESWDSCDNVIAKEGDIIEFKNTCWAAIDYGYGVAMDETDVLLDKVVYHYLKTLFKETLENLTTYNGSTYWEMLILDMMKRSGLDSNLTNIQFKEELKNELNAVDVTTLTGANLAKYYTHAKALNIISKDFNAHYQTQLDTLTEFNAYTTPFVLLPNADLKLTSTAADKMTTDAITKNIMYGPCGDLWKLLSQALFVDRSDAINLNDYVLDWQSTYDFGSNADCCTVLTAASALGENVRDTSKYNKIKYNDTELDYVSYILARYYDSNLKLVKAYENDTKATMSTNQIYAGLLSYKVFRYTNQKANIFGQTE